MTRFHEQLHTVPHIPYSSSTNLMECRESQTFVITDPIDPHQRILTHGGGHLQRMTPPSLQLHLRALLS
jgi:hypothetical protein